MLVFTILKAIECGKESLKKITELLEKKKKEALSTSSSFVPFPNCT